jgi:hypothetical protein
MSSKKTIQINPELFKISGQKTRKNREKKDFQINPIINPNNLKNKLLKRIKEHKTKELKQESGPNTAGKSDNNFSDEFYSAVNYLSDLSKKQKQQKILHNKTVKNYAPVTPFPNVSLELPPELEEPIKSNLFVPQSSDVFNVNYKTNEDIPYGCLKNGKKKTYREWKELTRAAEHPEIPSLVRPPTPPKKNLGVFLEGATVPISTPSIVPTQLSREQRLEQIKTKLKKLQDEESQYKMKVMDDLKKIETDMQTKLKTNSELEDLPDIDTTETTTVDVAELIKTREEKIEKETPKQYLKKTVKRKFTLGRSDKLKKVAVLIKDKKTRKNIINTQKELKKMNITDVRKYLRQHGIIKVGSTCPPEILRKTFESALMAGEVTNINKDMLLHNFLSSDKSE